MFDFSGMNFPFCRHSNPISQVWKSTIRQGERLFLTKKRRDAHNQVERHVGQLMSVWDDER
jgi:hypothetical protein